MCVYDVAKNLFFLNLYRETAREENKEKVTCFPSLLCLLPSSTSFSFFHRIFTFHSVFQVFPLLPVTLATKLLAPMFSWPGAFPRTWVAARMFSSMSFAKYAQQVLQDPACAVETVYNLNHARWAWQKVVCRSPTCWPVCSTPLRSRLSTWWLSWVQKHPIMPQSMLAPASQVRNLFYLRTKISMSVSHSIRFYVLHPESFCIVPAFYLNMPVPWFHLCPSLSCFLLDGLSFLSSWQKIMSLSADRPVNAEELSRQNLPWRI